MAVYKTPRTTVRGTGWTVSPGWGHPGSSAPGGGGPWRGSRRAQSRVISLGGSVSLFSRAPSSLSMCAATTRHSSRPCRGGHAVGGRATTVGPPHAPSVPYLLQLELGDALGQEVAQRDLHVGVAGPGCRPPRPRRLDLPQRELGDGLLGRGTSRGGGPRAPGTSPRGHRTRAGMLRGGMEGTSDALPLRRVVGWGQLGTLC